MGHSIQIFITSRFARKDLRVSFRRKILDWILVICANVLYLLLMLSRVLRWSKTRLARFFQSCFKSCKDSLLAAFDVAPLIADTTIIR